MTGAKETDLRERPIGAQRLAQRAERPHVRTREAEVELGQRLVPEDEVVRRDLLVHDPADLLPLAEVGGALEHAVDRRVLEGVQAAVAAVEVDRRRLRLVDEREPSATGRAEGEPGNRLGSTRQPIMQRRY